MNFSKLVVGSILLLPFISAVAGQSGNNIISSEQYNTQLRINALEKLNIDAPCIKYEDRDEKVSTRHATLLRKKALIPISSGSTSYVIQKSFERSGDYHATQLRLNALKIAE